MTMISRRYTSLRALAVAAMAGSGLLCAGCAPKYENLKAFVQGHQKELGAVAYRLEPPDVIEISSPTAPELQGETQAIRSDGKVSLKLVGEVQAANLTPRELAAKIEELLARYYVSPSVSVRVTSFESKRIYVFGQVSRSGAFPFTGRDTVLDVLSEAKLNRAAWGMAVKVIRPSAAPNERREVVVDVDKMMQTGDLQANFVLQDGDIVFVPPTPLAYAGMVLQEVLFPFTQAAEAYSTPATFIAANEYYKDRNSGQSYVKLSPGSVSPYPN